MRCEPIDIGTTRNYWKKFSSFRVSKLTHRYCVSATGALSGRTRCFECLTRMAVAICRRPSSLLTSFKYLMRFRIYAATCNALCTVHGTSVRKMNSTLALPVWAVEAPAAHRNWRFMHFLSLAAPTLKVTADVTAIPKLFIFRREIYWETFEFWVFLLTLGLGKSIFEGKRWQSVLKFLNWN